MDLTSLLGAAQTQGLVFWLATASIALGLTLLVVALWQRRRRAPRVDGGAIRPTQPPAMPAATAAAGPGAAPDDAASRARAVYQELAGAAGAAREPEPEDDAAERSLALLPRRLQSAGDRLEELAAAAGSEAAALPDSVLKDPAPDVEYVFRASGP